MRIRLNIVSARFKVNIFVDESGSFVNARRTNSWNCIVAYMIPELDRRGMRRALTTLKQQSGVSAQDEVKLRDVRESDYFAFLRSLNGLNGAVFVVVTDAGLNQLAAVTEHQRIQAEKIAEHKDKMQFETARKGLEDLAEKVRMLPAQHYVQLHCQVILISLVILRGVLYFVQRCPQALGVFRWRIDQKNSTQTTFEETFVTVLPPILQTISLSDPLPMLEGADYSEFQRFDYPKGEAPTYLKDVYGVETRGDGGLNIGKLIRENLEFPDSKENRGVQVADLLASGLRRCLRGGFSDKCRAAILLGGLMVQGIRDEPPISLLGFVDDHEPTDNGVAERVLLMKRASRGMLLR